MQVRLHLALIVFALHCACQPLSPTEIYAPVARISPTYAVSRFMEALLDGSQSFDPDGDPLTFKWSFRSRPTGSSAVISEPTAAQASFMPDLKGDYVIQLVVSDGKRKSAPATINFKVSNTPPRAEANTKFTTVVDTSLILSGQGRDVDDDPLTYTWTLTQRPTGSSAVLAGADTATSSLTPDVEGDYQLTFVVGDGQDTSPVVNVTVTVHRPPQLLGHRVLDAEYSKALDRLVMVSDSPNALYVYDPVTQIETSVALPKAPTSVSVGPDGRFATVGHDALVSYVDLETPSLLKTFPVSVEVFDIILAGNGHAYVVPASMSWWENIHSVSLSTGAVTLSGGIYDDNRLRLHPSGTSLYVISADSVKYDISSGTAKRLYGRNLRDFLSEGCLDFWFSEDGGRILSECGSTFRSSSFPSEDMRYAGALRAVDNIRNIRHLSHSTRAGRIALVQKSDDYTPDPLVDTKVHLYMDEVLDFDRNVPLPPFMKEGKAHVGHGRFVFFNAAGDKLVVILQADPEAAMPHDYGIITY